MVWRSVSVISIFSSRNSHYRPIHHRAREYTRTLNAVKLDKVFAKPFVAALNGHMDGVCSLATTRANLTTMASGACDGEIRIWDVWGWFLRPGTIQQRNMTRVH